MAIDTLGANALASNSVTAAKIADDAVVAADIADGSVTTAKLAADAVTTVKIADDAVSSAKLFATNLGRRNLIINGNMNIAQRATSATNVGAVGNAGTYNAQDRWNFFEYGSTSARWTQSVSTDVPASSTHTSSLKLDCTTASGTVAAGNRQQVMQIIEAQDLQHLRYGSAAAKKITLSFWVKSSVTGKNYCWLYHNDGVRFSYKSYTVNSANTWEHKTITFTGDTASAITNDNGAGLNVIWMLYVGTDYTSATDGVEDTWASWSSGNYDQFNGQVNNASSTDNNWYLTGTQLEVGDAATDFEHHSFAEELTLCQRYFEKMLGSNATNGTSGYVVGAGLWYGAGQVLADLKYRVIKRAQPTIALSNAQGLKAYTSGAARTANDATPCDQIREQNARLNLTGWNSNGTAGYGSLVQLVDGESITMDAELG